MIRVRNVIINIVYVIWNQNLVFCIFVLCMFFFFRPPMPSKETVDEGDTCELDINNPWPSGIMRSERGEKDIDFKEQHTPEEGGGAGDVPWEKRYEKLWVEVEKREVKSTFKNVAGELKEKFGELLKSKSPAEEEATAESTSTEESSDDDDDDEEGPVIVRPAARARSTVLLTIPEQRESGLEDSVTESADNSLSEDRMHVSQPPPVSDSNTHQETNLHTGDNLEVCRESNTHHAATALTDGRAVPVSTTDSTPVSKDEMKLEPSHKRKMDLIWTDADIGEAEKSSASSEEEPDEMASSCPPLMNRRLASVPGVSDAELEDDAERFKLEVGMLKFVFLDLEKENVKLQKEVEDGRLSIILSRSPLLLFVFFPFMYLISILFFSCTERTITAAHHDFILFLSVKCSLSMY